MKDCLVVLDGRLLQNQLAPGGGGGGGLGIRMSCLGGNLLKNQLAEGGGRGRRGEGRLLGT